MAFDPIPTNPLFAEWIDILVDISEYDARRLARWLAAYDINPPVKWNPVIVGKENDGLV